MFEKRLIFQGLVSKRLQMFVLGASLLGMAGFGALFPWLTSVLVNSLVHRELQLSVAAGCGIALSSILDGACWFTTERVGAAAIENLVRDLRSAGYSKLLRVSTKVALSEDRARIQNILEDDVVSIGSTLTYVVLPAASGALTLLATAIAMYALDWRLASIALLAVVPWFAYYLPSMKRSLHLRESVAKLKDTYTHTLQSRASPGGLLRSAAFRSAEDDQRGFERVVDDLKVAMLRSRRRYATQHFGLTVWSIMAALLLTIVGVLLVARAQVSIGVLVAFITYQQMIHSPLSALANAREAVNALKVSQGRLSDLFALPEVSTGSTAIENVSTIKITAASFGYNSQFPVLRNITLSFGQLERVAIVGRSGSGKSTLLLLLQGLLLPDVGEVTVGDVSISQVASASLRNVFAYSSALLPIDSGRVDAAVFGERQPSGLAAEILSSTKLGDQYILGRNTSELSSGQLQRLIVARAVASNARILVLDEPTSYLDPDNELRIIKGLLNLSRGLIVATHSVQASRLFDRVVVMRNGEVAEDGAPAELESRNSEYANLLLASREVFVEGLAGGH